MQRLNKHEDTLQRDLTEALGAKSADVVLLCECGDIGRGLGTDWVEIVTRCCGPGFLITHQSHYTCIIRDKNGERCARANFD